MNRFRTMAVTAFAAFVLVACGPAASGSESQGGGASPPASQGAGASQGGAEPSFSEGVVADLEALIPDTVGELTMNKTSARGDAYLISPDSAPEMVQFVQDLGISPNDVSIAIGSGFNADFSNSVFMFVIRAKGADSNALRGAFKNVMNSDPEASPVEWAAANVGGKQVETSVSDGGSLYLYAKGDVLFWITASDPDTAAQIISDLP